MPVKLEAAAPRSVLSGRQQDRALDRVTECELPRLEIEKERYPHETPRSSQTQANRIGQEGCQHGTKWQRCRRLTFVSEELTCLVLHEYRWIGMF